MGRRKKFWSGFALGTLTGAAAFAAVLETVHRISRSRKPYIVRLEKSIQVGRPVEDVFNAWSQIDRLPRFSDLIESVTKLGNRSRWVVRVNGAPLTWEAEVEQTIPNHSIGWKSVRGTRHTGRIAFTRLGNDTLITVTMNYVPPLSIFRPVVGPFSQELTGYIEKVLRDFKAHMEGKGLDTAETGSGRATGTFGGEPITAGGTQQTRYGGPTLPVEFTRPPEAKS